MFDERGVAAVLARRSRGGAVGGSRNLEGERGAGSNIGGRSRQRDGELYENFQSNYELPWVMLYMYVGHNSDVVQIRLKGIDKSQESCMLAGAEAVKQGIIGCAIDGRRT